MAESESTPFGQYQLIEKIAQGGMAEIFRGKAMDAEGIERPVVIKRILPHIAASPEFVEMLIDEAKIAVMLSHGNIAQIYDLGKVADDYFIVMEYVEGKTLSQVMKRLRSQGKFMPVAYAASIGLEIASALDYMHRKTDDHGNPLHIVHRDISPQNVILSTAGTVKIIDFGIAKAKTKISTTDSGVLKGKFAYMSPEHAEGMKLDHRTDIFSLGIILFELLTGQRLFKGKNNVETIRKVKKSKVPTPSSIRSSIPKAFDKIVARALQRDRDKRYQSAHDLAQDLTKLLVAYYSEFSPRELVRYLPEIFPEIAPPEKGRDEETPYSRVDIPREKITETREDTVGADSEVIRAKLKETEVFEISGAEWSDEEDDENLALPVRGVGVRGAPEAPPTPDDELTSRIRITPVLRLAVGLLSLVILVTAVWLGVRHISPSPEPPPPVASTPPPPPPPAVVSPPAVVGTGSLAIDSDPRGAKIFLDDTDSNQKTPHLFTQLRPGGIKVGLYQDRYRFWEGTADIKAGQTAKLSAPLSLNVGDLEINSLPDGANVTINGKMAGKTPFRLTNLEPDTIYDVSLSLDGYETWTGAAKIFGGKNEVINAPLKKAVRDALP